MLAFMNNPAGALANEAALLARVAVDPAAFAAVYDHYFPRVYTYVRYRVRDAAVAEDLTGTIFERVLAGIAGYRAEQAPFAVWLLAIARHAVSDHLRAERRHRWLSLDVLHDRAAGGPAPEELVIAGETRAALLAAVARLADRERDLLALKFGARLTNRRIAELTGLSESNVGVILYRAVGRLRAELTPGGP